MKLTSLLFCLFLSVVASGQQDGLQHFRPYDSRGINIFETDKRDTAPFVKTRMRFGFNVAQDYQSINEFNVSAPVMRDGVDTNQLIFLTNGFNRVLANVNADLQLADGIRVNMAFYFTSRRQDPGWLKGAYIQFDKLLFLKSPVVDKIMKNITLKAGNYEVDYGDQHFRRSDGGNAMYNPFVENYILDATTTETGAEIYYHCGNGAFAMFGLSNGQFDPGVTAATTYDSATSKANKHDPAIHGKMGYDRQWNKDLRLRITGSFYSIRSAADNHLFNGDKAGSQYVLLMENPSSATADKDGAGRYNPLFSEQVRAFALNPYAKYSSFEFFLTLEQIKGRTILEKKLRTATQFAGEVVYRFPSKSDHFWIAGRYNRVVAALPLLTQKVSIERYTFSAGYFLTKNLMLKAEYVDQFYGKFPATDIRYGGEFYGWSMQAVLGF